MLQITVVTVCYNEKRVKETIESVLEQTYPDIECLVIDGASDDETLRILKDYSDHRKIRIFSERDFGIYNAMNRGIARAEGDYVIFLNAGDAFYGGSVVADAVSCIVKDTNAVYYGRSCGVAADGSKAFDELSEKEEMLKSRSFDGNMPCHQSIFIPKHLLREHYYRERYRYRADYEWMVWSVSRGDRWVSMPIVVNRFDFTGVGSRLKNLAAYLEEEREILREYGSVAAKHEQKACEEEIHGRFVSEKHNRMFYLISAWMALKQRKINIDAYLEEKGYRRIAIYGTGHIGQRLIDELRGSAIQIAYGIDRNADIMNLEIRMISPEVKELEEVDAVIVTAITYFNEIRDKMLNRLKAPVISLEDVIYEITAQQREE